LRLYNTEPHYYYYLSNIMKSGEGREDGRIIWQAKERTEFGGRNLKN